MNSIDCQSICFDGIEFSNFVSFVKVMNAKDKSKYSKLVILHVENNKLVCRALGDSNKYIEYYIDLYDIDENIIDEFIAISINDIATLIKCAADDKFIIRKCFNQFEFNVIGNGWLPFNTVEIDYDKYSIPNDNELIGKINSLKMYNAISSVLGYMQDSPHPIDKYIVFSKSKMSVTSRLSSVVMIDDFIDVIIGREDAARLKSLLKDDFELSVSKNVSDIERTIFTGPKFKFAVTASDVATKEIEYITDINNYITVKCDELYKLVVFAADYSASSQSIGLTIKDGKLIVSVKNRLAANHNSIISSNQTGNVVNTKEVRISPQHILKALKLFQDKHSHEINIYFNDEMLASQDRIIIFDKNTQAIINIQ